MLIDIPYIDLLNPFCMTNDFGTPAFVASEGTLEAAEEVGFHQ